MKNGADPLIRYARESRENPNEALNGVSSRIIQSRQMLKEMHLKKRQDDAVGDWVPKIKR